MDKETLDWNLNNAVATRDVASVRRWLALGADPNQPGVCNQTYLHAAALLGSLEVVQALIAAGADVNAKDSRFGKSPIFDAAEYNNVAICEQLLDGGADIDARDNDEQTPLHVATFRQKVDVLGLLLARGADVNARDNTQSTPLHSVSTMGPNAQPKNLAVAKLLIEAGADVNAQSKAGITPLHMAIFYGDVETAKYLIEMGATTSTVPKKPTGDYLTPFQVAVSKGNAALVGLLHRHGGEDLGQRTLKGRTLAQLAGKHPAVKEWLRSMKTSSEIQAAITEDQDGSKPPTSKRSAGMAPL